MNYQPQTKQVLCTSDALKPQQCLNINLLKCRNELRSNSANTQVPPGPPRWKIAASARWTWASYVSKNGMLLAHHPSNGGERATWSGRFETQISFLTAAPFPLFCLQFRTVCWAKNPLKSVNSMESIGGLMSWKFKYCSHFRYCVYVVCSPQKALRWISWIRWSLLLHWC